MEMIALLSLLVVFPNLLATVSAHGHSHGYPHAANQKANNHQHHLHKDLSNSQLNGIPEIVVERLNNTEIYGLNDDETTLSKRSSQCQFPSNENLISVTPNENNAGWALSPDQSCTPGNYCPYACPPGQLSYQWDPEATSYTYPQSQYGGLYCNDDGTISKPFPNRPYCKDGTGKVTVKNSCGDNVAFCQTVLPGNEAMLIPTNIDGGSTEVIAVPDTSYWASTAAHYYVNPPGVSTEEGCVWGSTDNPYGNWSPYVAGANTDDNDNTFVKIAWNPVYLEDDCPFKNTLPKYGVKISCKSGNCNGLPCYIDPSKNGVNEVTSSDSSDGAGSATFCVVTAESGAEAYIEVFEVGSSATSESVENSVESSDSESSSAAAPSSTTSTSSSSSSSSSSSTSTTSTSSTSSTTSSSSSTPPPAPTTTSTPTPTPTSTSTSSTSTTPPTPTTTSTTSTTSTSSSSFSSSTSSSTSSSSPSSTSIESTTTYAVTSLSSIVTASAQNLAAISSSEDPTHTVEVVNSFEYSRTALYNIASSAVVNSTRLTSSVPASTASLNASSTSVVVLNSSSSSSAGNSTSSSGTNSAGNLQAGPGLALSAIILATVFFF